MKRAHKWIVLVALALALTTMLPGALAYFTTNANAGGNSPVLALGTTTTDEEIVTGNGLKTLTVNNEGPQSVYVRARAFSGAPNVTLSYGLNGESWTQGEDGFWYYQGILEAGGSVEFKVEVKNLDTGTTGMPFAPGDDKAAPFDVTVVYEVTPVQYDANDQPYADWNLKLDVQPAPAGN